jgi:hypothetical protein
MSRDFFYLKYSVKLNIIIKMKSYVKNFNFKYKAIHLARISFK